VQAGLTWIGLAQMIHCLAQVFNSCQFDNTSWCWACTCHGGSSSWWLPTTPLALHAVAIERCSNVWMTVAACRTTCRQWQLRE
jgi:hypothetical protein